MVQDGFRISFIIAITNSEYTGSDCLFSLLDTPFTSAHVSAISVGLVVKHKGTAARPRRTSVVSLSRSLSLQLYLLG